MASVARRYVQMRVYTHVWHGHCGALMVSSLQAFQLRFVHHFLERRALVLFNYDCKDTATGPQLADRFESA
jgi:hypothetical protein